MSQSALHERPVETEGQVSNGWDSTVVVVVEVCARYDTLIAVIAAAAAAVAVAAAAAAAAAVAGVAVRLGSRLFHLSLSQIRATQWIHSGKFYRECFKPAWSWIYGWLSHRRRKGGGGLVEAIYVESHLVTTRRVIISTSNLSYSISKRFWGTLLFIGDIAPMHRLGASCTQGRKIT